MPRTFVFSVPVGPSHIGRLRHTLDSLSAQSVPVKVALCDASGGDECKRIAAEYPDLIAYTRHGPDNGQSAAINEGWHAIDGDVYSWLNADDYLAPNALALVDQAFGAASDIDVVYGQSLIVEEDDAFIGLHPAVSGDIQLLTRSNIISQPSCFYTKAALSSVGPINEDLEYVMDWDLWVRLLKAKKTFHYIPDVLSTVLWERGTKTSSVNKVRMGEIWRLTKASHSTYVSLKTMIGFYLHYYGEYSSWSPLFSRLIGLRLTGKARPTRIWKPAGQIQEDGRTDLQLHHFLSEQTSQRVQVNFFDRVTCDILHPGGTQSVQLETSIEFPLLLPPGQIVQLTFTGDNFEPTQISSVKLHF